MIIDVILAILFAYLVVTFLPVIMSLAGSVLVLIAIALTIYFASGLFLIVIPIFLVALLIGRFINKPKNNIDIGPSSFDQPYQGMGTNSKAGTDDWSPIQGKEGWSRRAPH